MIVITPGACKKGCRPPYFGHHLRTIRASRIAIPMATAAKQHGKFLTTKLGSPITSPRPAPSFCVGSS